MKTWNSALVVMTFFLTVFGTFMTRSGIVQSVHAFGEDNVLALQFVVFLAVILIVSIGLHRLSLEQARDAHRVRLVLLARVRVSVEQLDPARVRVLRPVRDDVPDDQRGGERLARLGRHPVLQQVDDAVRARVAVPRGRVAAARVAQDDARAARSRSSCSRSPRWR